MKFKSVKEMRNKLYKRTLLDEVLYYCFYIWWNKITDLKWQIPTIIQRARYGVGMADWWNFDGYLCNVILRGLNQLKKYKHGIPTDIYDKYKNKKGLTQKQKDKLAVKEWNTILDIMIRGFEVGKEIVEGNYYGQKLRDKIYEFERGMDYFKKYYFSLWD